MQIIDVINNDISIDENDIYAFMRAYMSKGSYSLCPAYYEGVRVGKGHIEKINEDYQDGKISKWEYLYILSFIESYLLLWDEDNELMNCISEKIFVIENED